MPQHTTPHDSSWGFQRPRSGRASDRRYSPHRFPRRPDRLRLEGPGRARSRPRGRSRGRRDLENVGGGLATGAVVGGILGAAAALLIPGVGPVLAGGILAPLLGAGATAAGVAAAGALAGAAAGGLVGAFSGLGIPEEEAPLLRKRVQPGPVPVTVKADNRYEEVSAILRPRRLRRREPGRPEAAQRRRHRLEPSPHRLRPR